ncbi:ABC transporter ATP-binding protein [Microbacteriaceae bacterium VKM Ac-2855]|nr:ABC transporter ATP-binding protein [Microbacteriaceae bacterium VKM Ac-2855]
MDTAVDVSGLRKSFGRARALDGLELIVAAGEVHGFLGPNGAGKSTTIRVLLGMIRADAGTARLLGQDPWRDAGTVHRRVAYVPGDVVLWPNLTGGEVIDVLTRLRGGEGNREEPERLLQAFQLDPRTKVRAYSKGNRQKVALVAAFATAAELYILDEPTSGLDPLMEQVFRDEVRRVAARGATVLLSSHILGEVEQLCDRVTIIRAGATVETGSLSQMRHLTRTEFAFEGVAGEELRALAHDLRDDAGRIRFTVDANDLPAVLGLLARQNPTALTVSPPSLEELFLKHYGAAVPQSERDSERPRR